MHKQWDSNALTRKRQIETEIDLTFCKVFAPLLLNEILRIKPKSILEVGSGTGHLAKGILKAHTTKYTAIEPSKGMYDVSASVLKDYSLRLENCLLSDFSDETKYDCVISHMVTHVVHDINEFFRDIAKNMKTDGVFVFTIPHPAFYNSYKNIFGPEYEYIKESATIFSFNISLDPCNKILEVPYYHRPLERYINAIICSGFNIEKMKEIYPDNSIQELYDKKWENPRYCMFNCIKQK